MLDMVSSNGGKLTNLPKISPKKRITAASFDSFSSLFKPVYVILDTIFVGFQFYMNISFYNSLNNSHLAWWGLTGLKYYLSQITGLKGAI